MKLRLRNVKIELRNANKVIVECHNIEPQQMGFNAEVNYTYYVLKGPSDGLWFLRKNNISP